MGVESLCTEEWGIVGVWHLTETLEYLEEKYVCHEYEKQVYATFRNNRRKREWLASRLLLADVLCEKPLIGYSEVGAPVLQGWNISITHASDYVAVILSEKFNVGIDIEDTNRRITPILPKFISEKETALARSLDFDCSFHFWCAKEALFKLVPDVGIDFKSQMELTQLNSSGTEATIVFRSSFEEPKVYRVCFRHVQNFLMAWIVE